jgi:hypothetical protein
VNRFIETHLGIESEPDKVLPRSVLKSSHLKMRLCLTFSDVALVETRTKPAIPPADTTQPGTVAHHRCGVEGL